MPGNDEKCLVMNGMPSNAQQFYGLPRMKINPQGRVKLSTLNEIEMVRTLGKVFPRAAAAYGWQLKNFQNIEA